MAPIIIAADASAEEYATAQAERLRALGCSEEHVAEVKADIIARAIHRGDVGDPQRKGD